MHQSAGPVKRFARYCCLLSPWVNAGVIRLLGVSCVLPPSPPNHTLPPTLTTSKCTNTLSPQVAANTKGIALVGELIREHGLPKVVSYMGFIQANAEGAVREMLKEFSLRQVGGRAGERRAG